MATGQGEPGQGEPGQGEPGQGEPGQGEPGQGEGASPKALWATVPTIRTVLFVVQNVTALNRVLDLIGVVAGDLRVQCMVTSDLDDPFAEDLPGQVTALGLPTIPWMQARASSFDLIVSAGHHGGLDELTGPLILLPHGNGFSKVSPGSSAAATDVYGLAPRWVLRDGHPFPQALVFSHGEQVRRLGEIAPAALPLAHVAGDPCFDRMLASRARRDVYRAALGVTDPRKIVLVSSTWSSTGLLGVWPQLPVRLLEELPPAGYQVVLVAHPNIWAWHGPFQLRAWLADCVAAGMVIVPPLQGWQAAVLASDVVIGDHGSVTVYAAGLGRPTLLGTWADAAVVPGSAAHRLGALAARLDPSSPLRPQLDASVAGPPGRFAPVADLVTAVPGEAMGRLRSVCYELMRLPEPDRDAVAVPFTTDGLVPLEASPDRWVAQDT